MVSSMAPPYLRYPIYDAIGKLMVHGSLPESPELSRALVRHSIKDRPDCH